MRVLLLIFAMTSSTAFGSSAQKVSSVQAEMQPLNLNDYRLVDAEYLPFVGVAPVRYPNDVQWGFYSDAVTAEAQACALSAFRQLRAFFLENPSELQEAVDLGATPSFFLWIDDYSEASDQRARRTARLWHLNPEGRDVRRGHWNWEAVLTQSGTCILPLLDEARDVLQRAADDLSFGVYAD